MAQETIPNGETKRLLNTGKGRKERDDDWDRVVYLFRFDGRVRWRESDSENETTGTDGYARTGVPLTASGAGCTFTYQPRGQAIYAYADGAEVTVEYDQINGRMGDFE
jgi:hypothetical protein